jgi:hypothetical protein
LAYLIKDLDSVYNISLNPIIYNPGTTASDHASFWKNNYSAIMIIEAYYGGDFNTYYHSSNNRINKLNLAYFHKLSKLSVAGIIYFAFSKLTNIKDADKLSPEIYLMQNYPNPFNPTTTINYQIPKQVHVTLKIFDVLGREVATLVNKSEEAGYKSVTFDANKLPSGVYFYRLQTDTFVQTNKMLLMK